jgi:hypothetical protein
MKKLPVWRMVFALAVLTYSAAVAISVYGQTMAAGGGTHQAGDWLISYPGEFVRRGLFGELLLTFAPPGSATLSVLFAIDVACYVGVFVFFVAFLFRSQFSWSAIALACSPAALAFSGWDPVGGFRKEVLGFVVLVLLAVARWTSSTITRSLLLAGSLMVWILGVFSWESLVFLLPGVGYLLLVNSTLPARRTLAAVYSVIGISGFAASALRAGNTNTPGELCAAVTNHGLSDQLCTGAIAWMGRGVDDSLREVSANLAVYSGYLVMLALAVLPIVLSPWLRRYWPWALAAAISIVPLFVLGIDYGRWIYILTMELTICMMVAGEEMITSKLWNPLSVGMFVTLWAMPHAAPTPFYVAGWPFKGLLASLINSLQTGFLALK